MRFPFRVIHDFEDVTRNFEAIEVAFGFPVYTAPPANPNPGQVYYDQTLVKSGYWNGTIWVYW